MRSLILTMLFLMGFLVIGTTQKVDSTIVKTHKKIIIKTVDSEGNVETKVFEGEDGQMDTKRPVRISKGRDSIIVEVIADSIFLSDSSFIDDFEPFEMGEMERFGRDSEWENEFPGHGRRMMIFGEGRPGFTPAEMDKARLGVFIEDSSKGVKVTEVEDLSAAYSVGILAGDVITKVNGVKITNVEELQREIESQKPGDMAKVNVRRNGKNKVFDVRLHGQPKMMREFNFAPEEGMFPPEMGRFNWQEIHSNRSDLHKGSACCEDKGCKGKGQYDDQKCCDKHDGRQGRSFHGDQKCCDKHDGHSGRGCHGDQKSCDKHDGNTGMSHHGDQKCCDKHEEKKKCNNEQQHQDSCKNKDKK